MKNLKKNISVILATLMLAGTLNACSNNSSNPSATASSESSPTTATQAAQPDATTTSETITSETTASEPTETPTPTPIPKESHYKFDPHIHSSVMDSICGDELRDTYFNLIDAVLAGESSFDCPSQETYDWVMGQYPYLFFPVLFDKVDKPSEIDENNINYSNGKGYIGYKVPYEELKVEMQDFIDLTEQILNDNLDDDYSDVEKALALYFYMIDNYEYDYDTEERMSVEYIPELSGYRLFQEGHGVCQEISVAYSYLLLEAGVDATVMKGVRHFDSANHQWSYVTINGKNYHIDATYGLGFSNTLTYFMMTDRVRAARDSYYTEDYIPSTVYAQAYGFPEMHADDNFYEPLWDAYVLDWDPDTNTITCDTADGILTFTYED